MAKKWKKVSGSSVGEFCLYANKHKAITVVAMDEYFTPSDAPDSLKCVGWEILDQADCALMFSRMRRDLDVLEKKALRLTRRLNAERDKSTL